MMGQYADLLDYQREDIEELAVLPKSCYLFHESCYTFRGRHVDRQTQRPSNAGKTE